ncbi:hypothetical protein PYCCODRAFT_1461655 [Trametes coccinea BRFM310]|uniref:Fungal-type protein kinase domain-containing protein n=1 Tax=Trametes coccinea (strain BRFM310) TaxID=1353009 RepID=A0A1Y2IBM4_TRAC3|nr:hypothetical protein PYCCODRAFT_1461655 [Trametes coccinea BRFM310]
MTELLEGPTASWLQRYTSNRVTEGEVDQIISALKNEGLVLDHRGTLRWKDFPDRPSALQQAAFEVNQQSTWTEDRPATPDSDAQEPSGQSKAERAVFRPLGTIINAIVKVPLPDLSPSCRYEEGPYAANSELSESQHRVDGFLRLIKYPSPAAPKHSTTAMTDPDIAVNFVFKCGNKYRDLEDNRGKALDSALDNLRADCRRKHTYSITIEDNLASLWYWSRSHSAKSHEFDLLDVRAVVWAFSALIFSTVEDLGYDTNIRRIHEWDEAIETEQIRYVYRLDDRFFKTLVCRDKYKDAYIAGRATRVWEVVEVTSFDDTAALPNAQRMVLRDVWLEHDSNTEREIQEEIFRRCDELGRNFLPEDDARLHGVDDATRTLLHQRLKDGSYKQLFLTIEADYRGATSKPRAEGFTPAPHIYDQPVSFSQVVKRHASDARGEPASRTPPTPNPAIPSGIPRAYNPRQRNFVVYQEVCSALHELDDLYDVLQALLDALLALQILFLICWVHRDVSSGNILSHNGHGKLSDLEYSKEFSLSSGSRSLDPKTATVMFMAVELRTRSTIYKEIISLEDMKEYNDRPITPPPRQLAFRHNFQHDLESVFWILTWLVFTHIPGQDCAHVTDELFQSQNPHFDFARREFLTDRGVCARQLESLRRDLPPVLAWGVLAMRGVLYVNYCHRKSSYHDMATYSLVYGQLRKILEAIVAGVPRGAVRIVPGPSPR